MEKLTISDANLILEALMMVQNTSLKELEEREGFLGIIEHKLLNERAVHSMKLIKKIGENSSIFIEK